MENRLNHTIKNREASLYTFYSAKKIYLAHTPSKYILIEKKNSTLVHLSGKHCVVSLRDNGFLMFPTNNR